MSPSSFAAAVDWKNLLDLSNFSENPDLLASK
jgi:hypothetical protein